MKTRQTSAAVLHLAAVQRWTAFISGSFWLAFQSLVLSPTELCAFSSIENYPEEEVILRFGGDCLFAEHYEHDVGNNLHRSFDGFDLFRTADVTMVNLECPITLRGTKQKKPFTFRMRPSYVEILVKAGIDLVNIANNHIFDYGSDGLFDTVQCLDSAGVRHVGAGMDREDAHRPVVMEIKGTRIGFLGYYGGEEAPGATRVFPGVARRTLDFICADIKLLREQDKADFVIVNLHWGEEKATVPGVDQVDFAHRIIDDGADVVIGHHPHVLQGIERYNSGIIAYSLGNLIFGGNSRSSYDTAILEIKLYKGTVDHRLLPVRVTEWNAQAMTGADAEKLLDDVELLPIPGVDRSTNQENRK